MTTEPSYLASVVQAYHFWKSHDEIEVKAISRNKGDISDDTMTRIFSTYSIARSVALEARPTFKIELSRLRHKVEGRLLTEIAGLCSASATAISPDKKPYSAVSKFLWFLAPNGWTMYDSYAAKGAGLKQLHPDKFMTFYHRLSEAGFAQFSAGLRKQLPDVGLPEILAERIIDWHLMARGGRNDDMDRAEWAKCVLAVLPEPTATAMRKLEWTTRADMDGFRPEDVK